MPLTPESAKALYEYIEKTQERIGLGTTSITPPLISQMRKLVDKRDELEEYEKVYEKSKHGEKLSSEDLMIIGRYQIDPPSEEALSTEIEKISALNKDIDDCYRELRNALKNFNRSPDNSTLLQEVNVKVEAMLDILEEVDH